MSPRYGWICLATLLAGCSLEVPNAHLRCSPEKNECPGGYACVSLGTRSVCCKGGNCGIDAAVAGDGAQPDTTDTTATTFADGAAGGLDSSDGGRQEDALSQTPPDAGPVDTRTSADSAGFDGPESMHDAPVDAPVSAPPDGAIDAAAVDAPAADVSPDLTPDLALPKGNGSSCAGAGECQSGNCVDGVCCDLGCSGRCMACNVTGELGKCLPVAPGSDPRNDCSDDGAGGCKQDGTCDGAGACRLYRMGQMCAVALCSGGTAVSARTCDGSGTCGPGTITSCGAYACNTSGACHTTCSSPSHCAANHTCDSQGSCVPNAEVCNNGMDDDGDGAIDCADSQCTTHVCAPTTPAGWVGPMAMRDDPTSASPACAGPYASQSYTGGRQVNCPAHTCGVCSCGSPPGVSCDTPIVSRWSSGNPTCSGPPVQFFPAPACAAVDGRFMTDAPLTVGSGTCAGQRGPDDKPTPAFTRTGVACTGVTAGGGCPTGQCLPNPGAPFEAKPCIYRAGDLTCPAGYTANRRVYYQNITDGRTCTTCSCGSPVCKGRLWTGYDSTCPTGDGTGAPVPVAACTEAGGILAVYMAYVPLGPSCTPGDSAEGGSCTPDATTATTVCCMP
jgi:hypothetical protein